MRLTARWDDRAPSWSVTLPSVLILLPPSEGKTAPEAGSPVDLDSLSFPELTGERVDMLAALVLLCRDHPETAATTLGLGPTQSDEVVRNAGLPHAPAAPARDIYSGVLYDALGLARLDDAAAARAESAVVIASGLWGALRPSDAIPAYRLGGSVTVPGAGRVSTFWRPALAKTIAAVAEDQLVVDLRSTTYASFWRPRGDQAARTVTIRVLHEHDGRRSVVSHHNKATKGHIARQLLGSDADPCTAAELADLLVAAGWTVETQPADRPGAPTLVDVVVTEIATSAATTDAARTR